MLRRYITSECWILTSLFVRPVHTVNVYTLYKDCFIKRQSLVMQLLKAAWLCYWLISSTASSEIYVTSASLQRRDNSNPNTGAAKSPNGSEAKSRWPKRFRSSEAEVMAYSLRHPNVKSIIYFLYMYLYVLTKLELV